MTERPRFSPKLLHPRYIFVWFGFALWWLVVQVLPFRVMMYLGGKIGRLVGRLSTRRQMIARKNIALCFPELSPNEQNALMWKTMESTGKGFFDTGIAWFWPYSRLQKLIDVQGLEHLSACQENGDGVLLFTYHFTSLEITSVGINRNYNHPVYGVYRPHGNAVYDYVMRKGRERHSRDFKVVPRNNVRAMVKVLRRNHCLSYLPDQDYGHKYSVFVPFFGVETATVSAPSQLAKMGRAKVMSFYAVRKPDNSGYLVNVCPPHEGYGKGDECADAMIMNQFLESVIREYPDQYLWVHRRFKSRPDNDDDFYGLKVLKSYRKRLLRRERAHEAQQKERK